MIKVSQVSKTFRRNRVLDRVDLEVPDSSVAAILGPSGIGKTVLLRIMAGLLAPDSGRVFYDGVPLRYGLFADSRQIANGVGFVFQQGALFDSMTVADNVALPLRETRHLGEPEVGQRVRAALDGVGMGSNASLYPRVLSGGMLRLVAIARAVVTDPHYVFFDEPTTALDPAMRERILDLIRQLRDRDRRAVVMVTHDLDAAREAADRLHMLVRGRLTPANDVRKEDYEQAYS